MPLMHRPNPNAVVVGAAAATAKAATPHHLRGGIGGAPFRAATTTLTGNRRRPANVGKASSSSSPSLMNNNNHGVMVNLRGKVLQWVEQEAWRPHLADCRRLCDTAVDELEQQFLMITQHILSCTEPPPSSSSRADSAAVATQDVHSSSILRLDDDETKRVLKLKVAELKDELAKLRNVTSAQIAQLIGSKKDVLQQQLLQDLLNRKQQKMIKRNDTVQQGAAALTVKAKAISAAGGTSKKHCDLKVSSHGEIALGAAIDSVGDDDDDDGVMEIAPNDAKTNTGEKEVAAAAIVMSPPKVSETAFETIARTGPGIDTDDAEVEFVGVVPGNRRSGLPGVEDDDDEVEILDDLKPSSGNPKNTVVVDTTLVSVPFDEVTTAPTATETAVDDAFMLIDQRDDDSEGRTGSIIDDDVIMMAAATDSGRKRSRSPSSTSASSSSLPNAVMGASATLATSASDRDVKVSSGTVQKVQATLQQLSVHHSSSPHRKLPKLGDIGSALSTSSSNKFTNAMAGTTGHATVKTGTSDAKIVTSAATSVSVLTKRFDNDRFPLTTANSATTTTTTTQKPSPAAESLPKLLHVGRPVPPPATTQAMGSSIVEKMRIKSKITSSTAPVTGSHLHTLRPSPIVEVPAARSAYQSGVTTDEQTKKAAMHSNIRQKALESIRSEKNYSALATSAASSSSSQRFLPPFAGKQQQQHTASKAVASPMIRPSPVVRPLPASFTSPAAKKHLMLASSKKAAAPPSTTMKPSPYKSVAEASPNTSCILTDSDEEMSDDGGYDGKSKKTTPTWARYPALKWALERQNNEMDPDSIFGDFTTQSCDLVAIFGESTKERYRRRGSSGNWTRDRLTDREKHNFNLQQQQQRHHQEPQQQQLVGQY